MRFPRFPRKQVFSVQGVSTWAPPPALWVVNGREALAGKAGVMAGKGLELRVGVS